MNSMKKFSRSFAMGLEKSFFQNTSKRLFLYFESWCDNNCEYSECYRKNSGNVVSKYASKTLIEKAFIIRYIGFFCTQLKIGMFRCKNAITKRPRRIDLEMYILLLCPACFLVCRIIVLRFTVKETLE